MFTFRDLMNVMRLDRAIRQDAGKGYRGGSYRRNTGSFKQNKRKGL